MTTRREIARSLVGGIWRTGVVDEDTNGGGAVLTRGAPVTVSSAEILAIDGTPGTFVEIVPAPSISKMLILVSAVAVLQPGATPYADGSDLLIAIGFSSIETVLITAPKVRQTTEQISICSLGTRADAPVADTAGQPLVITSSGVQFTDGTGTLEITPVYYTVDV